MASQNLSPRGAYVYRIIVDDIVRYIGKGTGKRFAVHIRTAHHINRERERGLKAKAVRFHNRLAKALRNCANVEVEIIADNLAHADAFDLEVKTIGCMPGGQLWNITSGGDGLDRETAVAMWADPDFRQKMVAIRNSDDFRQTARRNSVKQFADPQRRAAISEASKNRWRDVSYRERAVQEIREFWLRPEVREKHRSAVQRRWESDDQRKQRAETTRLYMSTTEMREQQSKTMTSLWANEEFRRKCTAQWSDPEKRALRAAKLTPEFLRKRGEAIRAGHARRKEQKP